MFQTLGWKDEIFTKQTVFLWASMPLLIPVLNKSKFNKQFFFRLKIILKFGSENNFFCFYTRVQFLAVEKLRLFGLSPAINNNHHKCHHYSDMLNLVWRFAYKLLDQRIFRKLGQIINNNKRYIKFFKWVALQSFDLERDMQIGFGPKHIVENPVNLEPYFSFLNSHFYFPCFITYTLAGAGKLRYGKAFAS